MERRLAAILAADMVGYSRLMAEDELDELAADIKTNGLQQPIVLADFADEETGEIVTMLVDGRNRLYQKPQVRINRTCACKRFKGGLAGRARASYALSLDNRISSARCRASVAMVNGGAIRMRSPSTPPPRINTRWAKHALTRLPAFFTGRNDRLGPIW